MTVVGGPVRLEVVVLNAASEMVLEVVKTRREDEVDCGSDVLGKLDGEDGGLGDETRDSISARN
jgi:hypothetical protein